MAKFEHKKMAKAIDMWRVFPRGFLLWYAWLVTKMCFWFWGLISPTSEQTVVIGAIIGMAVPLLNWYMQNSYDWTKEKIDGTGTSGATEK